MFKNIICLLFSFSVVFALFICVVLHCSSDYFKPYGNESVSLDQIILIDNYSETDSLFSDDELYAFLKNSSYKSVGKVTELKVWSNYNRNIYNYMFYKSIDHTDGNMFFKTGIIIKNGKNLYIQCAYSVLEYDTQEEYKADVYHTLYKVIPGSGSGSDTVPEIEDDQSPGEKLSAYLNWIDNKFIDFVSCVVESPLKYIIPAYWIIGLAISIGIPVARGNKTSGE